MVSDGEERSFHYNSSYIDSTYDEGYAVKVKRKKFKEMKKASSFTNANLGDVFTEGC